jgi:hypothetical protein
MKYIFSLFLVCTSYFSFGQMTVSDMMKIYNMDLDQFETYAIRKGYHFYEVKSSENTFGHSYQKGTGNNTKYLTLYNKFFLYGSNLSYQTSNSNEYLLLKNELKTKGFLLKSSETFEGTINKIYKYNSWVISIYTGKNEENNEFFEINLKQQ